MAIGGKLAAIVRVCRPHQWTKNLIVWAPLLFAKKITDPYLVVLVAACMVAMCAMSSAVYVLNDLIDRKADQVHPTKKNRPIAAGLIGTKLAITLVVLLSLFSMVVALLVRPSLILVVAGYLGLMLLYATYLKNFPILDVGCIAVGFVLRAVGGAAAAHVPVSPWFLICTSLGALFLGLEKRRKELVILDKFATDHRSSLSGYTTEMLNRIEGLILPSLLTCYAIYSFQSIYGSSMLLTLPFVLYGVMRYQMLSTSSTSTAAPDKVLLTDRPLQVSIVLWLLTASAVVYDALPIVYRFLVDGLDKFVILR